MKVLRTNRRRELVSHKFNQFREEQGLQIELTATYTQEQNKVAEQKNRIIVEMTRSLLTAKGLPNYF